MAWTCRGNAPRRLQPECTGSSQPAGATALARRRAREGAARHLLVVAGLAAAAA
eukprot:CAMPEP_0175757048 /NCGR_PEP_ID=MMETSP0097-20121207/64257_1 /TAXON_ID=311494 /ORGANISM="Alexandrium monilatum, Strain CCMP3105" /LENGTH=53 /DNA_ID=CAMNT_0017066207 /DNA_START=8 /DNA_END=165 /DNA_ORIENTATION=-